MTSTRIPAPSPSLDREQRERENQQWQETRNKACAAQSREKAQTTSSPTNRLDLFGRIQQGDYVWSRAFPEKDQGLFGFGVALRRTFDEQCPGAISAAEATQIEYFLGGLRGAEFIDTLHGRRPLDLEALMQKSFADVPFIDASRSRLG